MAEGMKSEEKDKASGITYESCMDKPVAQCKKCSATNTPMDQSNTVSKKQRKIPGPCSSCKGMGHATSNNKKCPNYKPKHVTLTPEKQQNQDDLFSFHDSNIPASVSSSVLNEVVDLDKPLQEIYKEELAAATYSKDSTQ